MGTKVLVSKEDVYSCNLQERKKVIIVIIIRS
jgi:hypothetical protein